MTRNSETQTVKDRPAKARKAKAWTTPKVVEIPVGMEINGYACAEL
jgi:coenzyme PQQ precursor peptide PqqA